MFLPFPVPGAGFKPSVLTFIVDCSTRDKGKNVLASGEESLIRNLSLKKKSLIKGIFLLH